MDFDTFSTYEPHEPTESELRESFATVTAGLDEDWSERSISRWEQLQADVVSWFCWTHLLFSLDTTNETNKLRKKRSNPLKTLYAELQVDVRKRFLEPSVRADAEALFGELAVAKWEASADCFHPDLEPLLEREQDLISSYMALSASGKVLVDGEMRTLSSLRAYAFHPDRALREEAHRAQFGWYEEQGEAYDRIFDELVATRQSIAEVLGEETHTPVAYKRMGRTRFGPEEVETFRTEILTEVVPLVAAYRSRQAKTLGIDRVRQFDEFILSAEPTPKPANMLSGLSQVFAGVHPELGDLYDTMTRSGLLDLEPREGKAGGGFATTIAGGGVPFIFGNTSGSTSDVGLLTHEMGHGFQLWSSAKHLKRRAQWSCTADTAEVHSMSLELLALPHIDAIFDTPTDAAAYRESQLVEGLLMLPYTAAIDHFQHLVYASPNATPAERCEMWRATEQLYLPWRDESDVPALAAGRLWQRQMHVFFQPFYYIDYALARTVSLQIWQRAQNQRADTVERYVRLCREGGRLDLGEVAEVAGVRSPFQAGCLRDVVRDLASVLR